MPSTRSLLFTLVCLAAIVPLRADEDADRLDIVRRARIMIDSTFKGDLQSVLKFMHPDTVKLLGGEEPVRKAIAGVSEQMKQLGIEFVSMDVRPPARFYARGQRTFTVVETTTVMQIPTKMRITEDGSLLAVRDTLEGVWFFVRVNAQLANDRTVSKALFPDFPDELSLRPPTAPVMEPLRE